jgi:hypothetical protein
MQRHAVRSLILGSLAAFLLAVGPVAGKMPFFSIELSPSDPRDGDVIVIVVRMWDDAGHTTPATWWPEPTIEGLVEARGPAGRVPFTLLRLDDATYRAEVTLSEGTWQLVTFPRAGGGVMVSSGDGYPGPLTVTVGPAAADTAGVAIAAGGALGVATITLLVGGPVRRRLRRRLARGAI